MRRAAGSIAAEVNCFLNMLRDSDPLERDKRGVLVLDVTLHIGAHRTGTTSLQQLLGANAAALNSANAAYWGPNRTRSGLFSGFFKDPTMLTRDSLRRAKRSTGVIQINLQRLEAAGMGQLIVSEENMMGGICDNLVATSLYPFAADRLSSFRRAFAGRRLQIALTIRSYEAYWASALAFSIKRGFAAPETAHLDLLVTQPRRWQSVIEAIVDVFPEAEVSVMTFEGFAGYADRHLDLLLARPLRVDLRQKHHWHNASPSRDKLRKILADRGDDAAGIKEGGGKWQPFDPHHIKTLREQYARDLKWLASDAPAAVTFYPHAPGAMREGERTKGRERHDRIERCVG